MSNDPILNSAMKKHPRGQVRVYDETGKRIAGTSCGGYLREYEDARKPRTVTTAAELNALRHGSVLLTSDRDDTALLKDGDVFRNQSGADVTTEILISYGTQPFTVLYEPTA